MPATTKRLAAPFMTLCEAVSVSFLPILSLPEAQIQHDVLDVLDKVSKLTDAAWAALPLPAQELYDRAVVLANDNKSIVDLVVETIPQVSPMTRREATAEASTSKKGGKNRRAADQAAAATTTAEPTATATTAPTPVAPPAAASTEAAAAAAPVPKKARRKNAATTATPPTTAPVEPAAAPAAAPVVALTSESGQATAATLTTAGAPGGGKRKNPASDWVRDYVVDHPTATVTEIYQAMLQQGFTFLLSKGAISVTLYEWRQFLTIIKNKGLVIGKAA
ncbi:MAG: hypothetical protein ACRD34_00095 [Bryobacteraceae bacterium]